MGMSRVAGALGGLILWAAVVGWLTWPLGAHLSTHLPDTAVASRFDSLFVAWALAHQSRALVTDPRTLPDGNIYYPARRALFYGEAGFGAVPYFMPTFLLTGNPALALNLVFLGSLALTAWGLGRLVCRFSASRGAAFVAGLTFLTTPWVLRAWVPAAPNYAVLQYFPFIMLLTARASSRARDMVWLVLLVVLQGLTSAYVAAALIAPLVILGLARLVRPSTRAAGLRMLAAVAVAMAILTAAYAEYLLVRADNPRLHEQTHWPLQATSPAPWIGPFGREAPTGVPVAVFVLIGLGVVCLAARFRRADASPRAPLWKMGAFWTIAGFLLAVRPRPSWRDSAIAFPHSVVAQLTPLYTMLRIPERLGIGGLMGLSVLAGVAFAECAASFTSRVSDRGPHRIASALARATLLALAVAAMCMPWPLPAGSSSALNLRPPTYALFRPIAPEAPLTEILRRSRGPLLEIPVEGGPWAQASATYRSIFHRRPLLNGYSGYWPAGFPERMALASRLPDPAALDALSRTTGLQQLLVHTAGYRPEQRELWLSLAARITDARLMLVARDGPDLLFEVLGPAASRAFSADPNPTAAPQ